MLQRGRMSAFHYSVRSLNDFVLRILREERYDMQGC